MINIPQEKIPQFHAFLIRKQDRNEVSFRNLLLPILRRQWNDSISDIENGNINITQNVTRYASQMVAIFRDQYERIGEQYFTFTNSFIEEEKSFKNYNTKDTEGIFDQVFQRWIENEALNEVVSIINPNTIKAIRTAIDKGVNDGKSYGQIAKDMRAVEPSLNRYRSARIARTEVHNVFAKSVDETIKASKINIGTKEWVSFLDERTRVPHADVGGTRVPMNDYFHVGMDRMLYPGDSLNGGPDNIIQCRCIVLYYT